MEGDGFGETCVAQPFGGFAWIYALQFFQEQLPTSFQGFKAMPAQPQAGSALSSDDMILVRPYSYLVCVLVLRRTQGAHPLSDSPRLPPASPGLNDLGFFFLLLFL